MEDVLFMEDIICPAAVFRIYRQPEKYITQPVPDVNESPVRRLSFFCPAFICCEWDEINQLTKTY
jgi:hypothetical protein